MSFGGEKMSLKQICFVGLIALAFCITAASAQDSTLRVYGMGTVQVPADTIIIAFSSQNESDNITLAEASNSELLNKTEKAIISAGVMQDEIVPNRPRGHFTYSKMICNEVNNTTSCSNLAKNVVVQRMIVKMKTSDVNQTQKVIAAAESAGSKATILGYSLNDSSKAIDQARKKALNNAKDRAENYASSVGFTLGKSMEIEEPRYPDIDVGQSYSWDKPRRMSHFGMDHFPRFDRFFGGNCVPEGVAYVTAYVSVAYKI